MMHQPGFAITAAGTAYLALQPHIETMWRLLAEIHGPRPERTLPEAARPEPARSIMLDLAVSAANGRSVSITSACIASGVPQTTALRLIAELQVAGLVERHRDPEDNRRTWLVLTGAGVDALGAYLASVGAVQ